MRAVDTNILVRLITRDDPRQVPAAETFVARGAWVSHVVLVEAMWILTSVYGLDAPALATAVEMLLNHRDLTVQDGAAVAAAPAAVPSEARAQLLGLPGPRGGTTGGPPSARDV